MSQHESHGEMYRTHKKLERRDFTKVKSYQSQFFRK